MRRWSNAGVFVISAIIFGTPYDTRDLDVVSIGSSVRGSLAVERVARAWALLNGRGYVVPEDVERLFVAVLGHRVVLTPSPAPATARSRIAGSGTLPKNRRFRASTP